MEFKDLIDHQELLRALTELGFQTPTPIQEKTIPHILSGKDVRASAQTGTGKTAAFLLPALIRLSRSPRQRGPRVLILAPTRELAMQIAVEANKLGRYLNITTVCVFGGVPYPEQNRKLSNPYDLLIATPGRLMDHMDRNRVNLKNIEMLILDEADRMLDMGFIEPVEHIASKTPASRQTLMFSATFHKKVLKLASSLLRDPIDIKSETADKNCDQIEQTLHRTDSLEEKHRLLGELLSQPGIDQAIVFSATKMQTERLSDLLQDKGFNTGALHGDMNQRERTRTLRLLREKKIQILVATDVAARGIDVLTISHVINFDLPHNLEDYIHRIGRTGRAGAKGVAHSFVSRKDVSLRREIERFSGLQPSQDSRTPEKRKPFHRHKKNFGFKHKFKKQRVHPSF
ncbi:MAG: DEAD/DEAH box helicase [Verrucomicrobiota bacterium]|nr:DEAD/DEAH box helicase [Verrucomicrobiota bacterium]